MQRLIEIEKQYEKLKIRLHELEQENLGLKSQLAYEQSKQEMKKKRVLSAAIKNHTIEDIENHMTEQEKSPEHGLEDFKDDKPLSRLLTPYDVISRHHSQ